MLDAACIVYAPQADALGASAGTDATGAAGTNGAADGGCEGTGSDRDGIGGDDGEGNVGRHVGLQKMVIGHTGDASIFIAEVAEVLGVPEATALSPAITRVVVAPSDAHLSADSAGV